MPTERVVAAWCDSGDEYHACQPDRVGEQCAHYNTSTTRCPGTMQPAYAHPPRTVPVEIVRAIVEARDKFIDDGGLDSAMAFESALDAARSWMEER